MDAADKRKLKRKIQQQVFRLIAKNREELNLFLKVKNPKLKDFFIDGRPEVPLMGNECQTLTLVSNKPLVLPFDEGAEIRTFPTYYANGQPSNYFSGVSGCNKEEGELNFGLAMGKWFILNPNYLPNENSVFQARAISSFLAKEIVNESNVGVSLVKATINLDFPPEESLQFYVDRGNANLDFAGIELDIYISLGYVDRYGKAQNESKKQTFVRVIDRVDSDRITEYPNDTQQMDLDIRLPEGIESFALVVSVVVLAYTSNDVLNLNPDNTGEYGIATMDFRNDPAHLDLPLLYNPFTAAVPLPPGGIFVSANFEFYRCNTN